MAGNASDVEMLSRDLEIESYKSLIKMLRYENKTLTAEIVYLKCKINELNSSELNSK
jgi:hypothetical protein